MLTVIATIELHAGDQHRQAVLKAFQNIIPVVQKEPGCHDYELLVDHLPAMQIQTSNKNLIIMLERWQSSKALETHMQTRHMQQHFEVTQNHIKAVNIQVLGNIF